MLGAGGGWGEVRRAGGGGGDGGVGLGIEGSFLASRLQTEVALHALTAGDPLFSQSRAGPP